LTYSRPQSKPGSAENGSRPDAGGVNGGIVEAAIASARDGDAEALHFLYVRYADDVLGYVQGLVHDYHEAEDITQSVFLKLIRVIGKYEPREVPFAAWIFRVAHNVALDQLRAKRTTPREHVGVSDHDRSQISRERGRDLRAALERLPEEQREVLVLRHIVGLSPPEIAEVIGKTESSVHALHHRGRLTLRGALSELGATPVVSPSQDSEPPQLPKP
jgi:RNA polymerase sigma-70 factor, ECF subfamily